MNIQNTTPIQGNKSKYRGRKIAAYAGLAIGVIIIGCIVTLLLLPDSFYDGFLREKVMQAFHTAYPAYTLTISKVHYKVVENRIECDSVSLTANDSSFTGSISSMSLSGIKRMSLFRPERIASDILANSVIDVKNIVLDIPQSQYEFQCTRLRLSVPDSTVSIDTLELDPLADSAQAEGGMKASCTMTSFSARHVGWVQIIRAKRIDTSCFLHATIAAKNILADFPKSQYEFSCVDIAVSVPDSAITADSANIQPVQDDAKYFAGSNTRKTRFIADVPECRISGADCFAFFRQSMYRARCVHIRNASLGVLINKDKPEKTDRTKPPMPYELLNLCKAPLQIDSVEFSDGTLRYSERYVMTEQAAEFTADDLQILVQGIANRTGGAAATVIHAHGDFMHAGTMNMLVEIPVASPAFTMHYSGTTSKMDMTQINTWLVPGEHKRVTSGELQSSKFNINVVNGKANGTVQAIYSNLDIAVLDKKENGGGLFEQLSSFMARTFKIRGTNQPDKSGAMKIGVVKYAKKPDDAFFQFVWVALRGGICDIVGANF